MIAKSAFAFNGEAVKLIYAVTATIIEAALMAKGTGAADILSQADQQGMVLIK